MPDPFWAVPAVSSQCILNSHEIGGAGRRRVPQWWALYERPLAGVKHFIAQFLKLLFRPRNKGF
jgi:hypothetical protein